MKLITENRVRGVFGKAAIPWGSASIVNIPDLELPEEGVFVMSSTVEKTEKRGIIQCFNNVNHVYAFGQDPESSRYSVTLGVLMQASGCASEFKSGQAIKNIVDQYKKLRVSEHPAVVTMSIDDGSILGGILTGITVSVQNAEINLFSITLGFTDLDAA